MPHETPTIDENMDHFPDVKCVKMEERVSSLVLKCCPIRSSNVWVLRLFRNSLGNN